MWAQECGGGWNNQDKCSESHLMPDLLMALSGFANSPGSKVEGGASVVPGNGTPYRLRCTATLAEGAQRETPPTRLSDSAWMVETCMAVVTTRRRAVVRGTRNHGPLWSAVTAKTVEHLWGP